MDKFELAWSIVPQTKLQKCAPILTLRQSFQRTFKAVPKISVVAFAADFI